MRIALYAPLKPPDHPVPSGDRRMGQLIATALAGAGHDVELVSRFRSYDGPGNPQRQMRLASVGARLAARLARRLFSRPLAERPRIWITYHLYYKAPDWLGPRLAAHLRIPYVVIEASLAMKRAGSLWSTGHEAVVAALTRAAAVVSMHATDERGVAETVGDPRRLHRLKPFLDTAAFEHAVRGRDDHRAALAARLGLPPDEPWLLAIGMMRHGDKLASYRVLGEALARLEGRRWRLVVAGHGHARDEVHAALAALAPRVHYAGLVAPESIAPLCAACDAFVWPAINEAYGLALLEAQAAALPVVAGRAGGVPEIVADERTGFLVAPGDAAAFAQAVARLLDDAGRRRAMGVAAWAKINAEHTLPAASRALDRILAAASRSVP
jgi:glycosyltransferase involved in cell wall biosynthesis